MNHGPQKPYPRKPLVPERAGGSFVELPKAKAARTSRAGFWLSISIHAGLLAAACTFTFTMPTGFTLGTGEPPADHAGFQMAVAAVKPQRPEPEEVTAPMTKSAPVLPPQKLIVALTDLSSSVEWPEFTPIATPIAAQPSVAPTPAAATPSADSEPRRKSTTKPGRQGTKTGEKKGTGDRQKSPRAKPPAAPQLVSGSPPRYPSGAKSSKKSGKVGVLVRVLANGSAASTRVYRSSGNAQLDQAAVDAARSWKFTKTPTLDPGETVAVVVQVTFKL